MNEHTKLNKAVKYGILILVFVFSLVIAYTLQTSEFFKGVSAIPAVSSLLYVIWKIWRDDIAHEKEKELLSKQQDFVLGAASHMAEVVYDKHAKFCEEYIERVQKGFQELLQDGPSKNATQIGADLVSIRQKHSAWLTQDIEKKLKPFEQALIHMGAKDNLIQHLSNAERRGEVIDEVYRFFELIIGEKEGNQEDIDISIEKNIQNVRNILGVNTFTDLRLKISELALKRLNQ